MLVLALLEKERWSGRGVVLWLLLGDRRRSINRGHAQRPEGDAMFECSGGKVVEREVGLRVAMAFLSGGEEAAVRGELHGGDAFDRVRDEDELHLRRVALPDGDMSSDRVEKLLLLVLVVEKERVLNAQGEVRSKSMAHRSLGLT